MHEREAQVGGAVTDYEEVIRLLDLNAFLLRYYLRDRCWRLLLRHLILQVRLVMMRAAIEREEMAHE